MSTFTGSPSAKTLANATGVVIPVYFRADDSLETGARLLEDTVYLLTRELDNPAHICLSVDGSPPGDEVAIRLQRKYGVGHVSAAANRGKLAGVSLGARYLLADDTLAYIAAIDSDGDHFANELLNFVRAAEHVHRLVPTDRVLVMSNRNSRHRPLGYLRGELEDLADRILLDALTYHAAKCDKPLALQYATVMQAVPDFHSGYSLFSRATAQDTFQTEPVLAGCDADAYYRHACEAVMTVEPLLAGATLVAINRSTFDEQPVSSFARLDRARLHADLIIWPCKRLDIPAHFVAQWLDNHLPALTLGSLVPQGRDELLAVRDLVRAAFDLPLMPNKEIQRPIFI